MPHECTNCDRTFPDGSKEMLSGCPDCGGNKFRYRPSGGDDAGGDREGSPDPAPDAAPDPEPPAEPSPGGGSVTDAVRGATTTVRDWVGRGDDDPRSSRRGSDASTPTPDRGSEGEPATGTAGPGGATAPEEADAPDGERVAGEGSGGEDAAQASARSSMVHPDELPDPSGSAVDVDPSPEGASTRSRSAPSRSDPQFEGSDPEAVGSDPESVGSGPESTTPDPRSEGSDPARPGSAATPGRESGGSTAEGGDPTGDGPARSPPDGDSDAAPSADGTPPSDPGQSAAAAGGADLAELRRELDDQFESIKIVEPGQYELNLMELYDREEYIISLMEDGRYAIEVPETWRNHEP